MEASMKQAETPPDELLKQHLVGELRSAEKAITVLEGELELSHRRMEQARRVLHGCRAALEVLDPQDRPTPDQAIDYPAEYPTSRGY